MFPISIPPCHGAATAYQLLEGGEGLEAEVAEEGELVGVAEVGQQQLRRGGGAGALGTLQHRYWSWKRTFAKFEALQSRREGPYYGPLLVESYNRYCSIATAATW